MVAVAAAAVAAWVAWRQLGRMTVQSDGLVREALQEHVRTAVRRRKWLIENLREIEVEVNRRLWEVETYGDQTIHPEWAASREQECDALLRRIKNFREEQLDIASIDTMIEGVAANLSTLSSTLNQIHRPLSMEQHDEDHSFTDDQWADIQKAAEVAEENLSSVWRVFSDAISPLDNAFAEEIGNLRARVRKIDDQVKQAHS